MPSSHKYDRSPTLLRNLGPLPLSRLFLHLHILFYRMSTHRIARKSIPLSDFNTDRSLFREERMSRVMPEQNTVPDTEPFGPDRSLLLNRKNDHNEHEGSVRRQVYWLYPTSMGISLLAGLIFAVGHHFFYRWLDGQIVGGTSKQQWSLR